MPEKLRKQLLDYITGKFPNLREAGQEAEDIVNQAFVRFYSGRNKNLADLNFGYLSRIAYNLALDLYNRQRRQVNLEIIPEPAEPVPSELTDLENSRPDSLQINAALEQIREAESEIIRLHYFGQHTFQEIADQTGLKLNTVLSHHRRGIIGLRNHFSLLNQETPTQEPEIVRPRQYRNFQLLDD